MACGREDNDVKMAVVVRGCCHLHVIICVYLLYNFLKEETACVCCVRVIPLVSAQYTNVYPCLISQLGMSTIYTASHPLKLIMLLLL